MAKSSSPIQDWKTGLYDSGEDGDCPRSCFIGCNQFGRTRHRLIQLGRQEDPLDLSSHNGCNASCWNYFLLCFGGLYIGSGIYTGKQTKQVRNKYDIRGTFCGDITKGIFCQPCSLIRNDLEIRRRETERKGTELSKGLRPPLPLGEENYQPLYAMPVINGYQMEPNMAATSPDREQGRELHFHQEPGRTGGDRTVPLYPTEQEIDEHERSWKGLGNLPQIPHVASPLDVIERRSQLLTPISERDSLEDQRAQQQKENVPRFPQVHHWLRSMSPSPGDKSTIENAVVTPGPGSPPALVHQGKPSPEASAKPEKKRLDNSKSPKPVSKKKSRTHGSKRKAPAESMRKTPEILVTSSAEKPPNASSPGRQSDNSNSPAVEIAEVQRSPVHNLSTDVLVPSPSESQRLHSLQADILIPSPSESQHEHSIEDDILVSSTSGSPRQHSIKVDPRVLTPVGSPMPEHSISADRPVGFLELLPREHSLGKDNRVSVDQAPFREHSLDSDEAVSVDLEEEDESEDESQGHGLPEDAQVLVSLSPAKSHDLKSDHPISTPKPTHAREHSLSRDIRIPSPAYKGPFAHGIHLDERVPTPELVRLNMEHDILQDRRVLTPSPAYEEHDLHADDRVKSPALLPPRQHSILSDSRVPGHTSQISEHGIQTDDMVASQSPRKRKDHSLSSDTKVAQRAHQLLEQFLDQKGKSPSKGSK